MRRGSIRWLLPAAAAAVLGVGAAMAATSSTAGHATVQARKTATLGTVLVAANGRVLYRFTPDRRGVDTCRASAACIKAWPPLLVPPGAKPTAGPGVNAALLGTIAYGAKRQVTYAGYPLYLFVGDKAAGDTYGEGLKGVWFVVNAKGALVKKASAASKTKPPTTTSSSSGGGYGNGYG